MSVISFESKVAWLPRARLTDLAIRRLMLLAIGALGVVGWIFVYEVLSATAVDRVVVVNGTVTLRGSEVGSPISVVIQHFLSIAMGLVVGLVLTRVSRDWLRKVSYPLLGMAFTVQVFVTFFGKSVNGSRRWVPVGPIHVQTAEILKLALCLALATLFTTGATVGIRKLLEAAGVAGLSILLVAYEDLGTGIILAAMCLAIFFVGGVPRRYLVRGLGLGALAALALSVLEPYRMRRIVAFRDPWKHAETDGYHYLQSLAALSRAGFDGVWLGQGQAKWGWLPNAHTDFIFAVLAEETGFIGGLLVLMGLATVSLCMFAIASRTRSRFDQLVVTGIATWVAAQALVNLSAVLGLGPITGVPLPFVSYGGSAMVMLLASCGIVVRASMSKS